MIYDDFTEEYFIVSHLITIDEFAINHSPDLYTILFPSYSMNKNKKRLKISRMTTCMTIALMNVLTIIFKKFRTYS